MGVREIRQAFNEVTGKEANCMTALLEYERAQNVEWQVLYFSGNYADGSTFAIRSDRIRPNGDVTEMTRATARRVLEQKGLA